jgi:hypothetical protein
MIFSYLPVGFLSWLICMFQDALAVKTMRECPADQKMDAMELEKIISEMSEPSKGRLILC